MTTSLRRHLTVRNLARVLLGVVIFGACYVGITFVQVWYAADGSDPTEAEAIVVLGAAQYDGRPSPVLRARLDRALELYEDGYAPLVVTTGANQEGDRFTEGFAGYRYLRDAGVADEALLVIVDGADTYESLAATAVQLRQLELDSVLLVSDPSHTFRLRQIADELGLDATVVPTDGRLRFGDLARETAAVSIGRLVGYRRLHAWT